jgi:hypothetical protein
MRPAGARKLIATVFKPQLTLTRPDETVRRTVGRKTKDPALAGFEERMMGFEPTTFCNETGCPRDRLPHAGAYKRETRKSNPAAARIVQPLRATCPR